MIVWLASYPRSGNTFLRVLLNQFFSIKTHSIYNDLEDIASSTNTTELVGHVLLPEDVNLDELRRSTSVYYIKTHGGAGCVESRDKVIYLIRDGRDSSISYLNYLKRYQDESVTIQDVVGGQVMFGSWSNHVEEWRLSGIIEESLLVRFEEMVKDPANLIGELSQVTGQTPVSATPPSFESLQGVNPKFFFRGQSGYWKTDLNEEDQLLFWLCSYRPMITCGYREGCPRVFQDKEILEPLLAVNPKNFRIEDNGTLYESCANALYLVSLILKAYQGRLNSSSEKIRTKNLQLIEKEQVIKDLKSDVIAGENDLNSSRSEMLSRHKIEKKELTMSLEDLVSQLNNQETVLAGERAFHSKELQSIKGSHAVELSRHKVEKKEFTLLLEDLVSQLNNIETMLKDERAFHLNELQIVRNNHTCELDGLRREEKERYNGLVKKAQEEHDRKISSLNKSFAEKHEISNDMIKRLEGKIIECNEALNKIVDEKSRVDLWVLTVSSHVEEFSAIKFFHHPLDKITVFRKLIKFIFKGYKRD